jgi:UDP-N-acetylmuramyl pentapeptide phosphotransferase/UDP-N-acetylglucosamine-1-phosphate transferase
MGDTGSLISGLVIGILTLKLLGDDGQLIPHYAKIHSAVGNPINFAVAVLIIPMADTIRIFFVRLRNRKSPFLPDRNHIHHLLVALGFSHVKASMILYSANIFFIALCLALKELPQNWVLLILAGTALLFSQLLYICKAQKSMSNDEILQPEANI